MLSSLAQSALILRHFKVSTWRDTMKLFRLASVYAPPKVEVTKTDSNSQQSKLDAYRMRAAIQLGLVAMERAKIFGTSLPLEREELEKLMEKS